MMRYLSVIIIMTFQFYLHAQKISRLDTVGLFSLSPNVYNSRITGDSLSSGFCIVIKKEVKAHSHLKHSEQIVVLEGEGQMNLGTETFKIAKGDLIFIPKNTVHSVKAIGETPLKVLSFQSPAFDGNDRVWVEGK